MTEPSEREESPLRAGDVVFHPSIALDFGYDSNFDRHHPSEGIASALRLRLQPSLGIATHDPTPGTVQRRGYALRADVGASYREIHKVRSDPAAVEDDLPVRRDLEGGVRVALGLVASPGLSGSFVLGLARSTRPNNEGDLAVDESRLAPEAGASLVAGWDHGTWELRLDHRLTGTIFEADALAAADALLNATTAGATWRFARDTALLADAGLGVASYLHDRALPDGAPTPATSKTTSYQLRARVGLAHVLGRSLAFVGHVGCGAALYDEPLVDFSGVVGDVELRFFLEPLVDPTPTSTATAYVAVGFERDFEDSFLGSHLVRSQAFARMSHLFADEYLVVAELEAGAVEFPKPALPSVAVPRSWVDGRVAATLLGEWRALRWFGLDLGITYTGYASEQILDPSGPARDPLAYEEVTAFVGQRLFW